MKPNQRGRRIFIISFRRGEAPTFRDRRVTGSIGLLDGGAVRNSYVFLRRVIESTSLQPDDSGKCIGSRTLRVPRAAARAGRAMSIPGFSLRKTMPLGKSLNLGKSPKGSSCKLFEPPPPRRGQYRWESPAKHKTLNTKRNSPAQRKPMSLSRFVGPSPPRPETRTNCGLSLHEPPRTTFLPAS